MKKYEYVSVHVGRLIGAKSEEHRQIIDEYAKKRLSLCRLHTNSNQRLWENQRYGFGF